MADTDLIEELRRVIAESLDAPDADPPPSLETALDVLKGDAASPSRPADRVGVIETGSPDTDTGSEERSPHLPHEVAASKVDDASDLPPGHAAPSPSAVPRDEKPQSAALQQAIADPDIYTTPADRERAIDLRWVLRDIKNNRLKLSPVDPDDLQVLIELGFVEILHDTPMLTNAGLRAI